MENSRSTEGWEWPIRQAAAISLPIASSIALAIAQLSRIGVVAAGLLLIAAGIVQRHRAGGRLRDARYRGMRRRLQVGEVGFARLWIATGILFAGCAMLLPPIIVAVAGIFVMPLLLFQGLASSGRSVDAEKPLGLSGRSAAEECGRVRTLADTFARVLRCRLARRFVKLANLRVKPNEIGVLQTLILSVIPIVFCAYASLAIAIGVTEVADLPQMGGKDQPPQVERRSDPPAPQTEGGDGDEESAPTYAESCPEIPDPMDIGHHLGGLFRHDGAPKAGCGGQAIEVPGTGAWVAAGDCGDEQRSVAVYAPDHKPVLLYGEPARFTWSAALSGELVSAEVAEPEGGDVYLVETLDGTSGFARPSPSLEPGREEIKLCSEATGVARPFAHLQPALAFLWLELLRDRTAWYWPENDPADGRSPIAFNLPGSATVARGGCDSAGCHLDVDGEVWPGGETAFVSLAEFEPYMPPSVE
jgi:hypothetical protein